MIVLMKLSTKALSAMIEIALKDLNCNFTKTENTSYYAEYEITAKDWQEEIAIDDYLNVLEDFAKTIDINDEEEGQVIILNEIKITVFNSDR